MLVPRPGYWSGRRGHFNLYVGMNNCGAPLAHDITLRIDDLRDRRNVPDYDFNRAVTQLQAQVAVDEADAIIADFQTILTTIPAQQIVDGTKHHLQLIDRIPRTP